MDNFYRQIPNDFGALGVLAADVSAYSAQIGMPTSAALHIDLAIEELLTNIIKYGFADCTAHLIEVKIEPRDRVATLTLLDDGFPFDPVAYSPQTVVPNADELDNLPVGGWGLSLVRQTAQAFTYKRENDRNISQLTYAW